MREVFIHNAAPQSIDFSCVEGLRVMIVEDDAMSAEILAAALSPMGLKISVFLSPKEAAEVIKYEKFDLFLLDVRMPEVSGFDLAQIIKSSGVNENTPVMFVSALSDTDSKITGYNLGSYAYIEKPFNIHVVQSQIYNILKTKSLQDASARRKETFLAMVTHDLKSPVNAEISALQLLLNDDKPLSESFQREIMGDLLGAAQYMKNLIGNVLGRYKFENGTITLNKSSFCLKMLIDECIEEMKYLLGEKGQVPALECSGDTYVNADYIEMKRVIHNILLNANEHGYKNTKIEMKLCRSIDKIVFSVKNYGRGICTEDPSEIFNKDFSATEKRTGTGLGLYIARQIISAHGGTIKAASKPDKWAKITFTMPQPD